MAKRDIVERLRDTGIDVSYRDRLRAAKEIERLRKALSDIIEHVDEEGHGVSLFRILAVARAALKGTP
jgi:hypothetical protein